MDRTWIVLLEAEGDPSEPPIDLTTLRSLIAAMGNEQIVAIYSPHRYALQLEVASASPAAAVFVATSRWEAAVCRLGLPAWDLQRVELVTPDEFERDIGVDDVSDAIADAAHLCAGGEAEASERICAELFLLQGGKARSSRSTVSSMRSRRRLGTTCPNPQ